MEGHAAVRQFGSPQRPGIPPEAECVGEFDESVVGFTVGVQAPVGQDVGELLCGSVAGDQSGSGWEQVGVDQAT